MWLQAQYRAQSGAEQIAKTHSSTLFHSQDMWPHLLLLLLQQLYPDQAQWQEGTLLPSLFPEVQ